MSSRREYRRGQADGRYERFHKNGQVAERGQSKAGRKTGTWARFSNQGIKTDEGPYHDGVKRGKWTRYHGTKGYKYEVLTYARDMKNGPAQSFSENGQLRAEGAYKDDERSGKWKFYDDGRLSRETHYAKGEEEGISRRYDEKGRVQSMATYKNGEQHGPYKMWSKGRDGALYLYLTSNYKDGEKHGRETFHRSEGGVSRFTDYKAGKKHGRSVSYTHPAGGQEGYEKTVGQHRDDKKHGEWREYWTKGQLHKVYTWRAGEKHGPFTEYSTSTGKKYRSGAYKNDRRHGEVLTFSRDGTVYMKSIYENGSLKEEIKQQPDRARTKAPAKKAKTTSVGILGTAGGIGGLGTRGTGVGGGGGTIGFIGRLSPVQLTALPSTAKATLRSARADLERCFDRAKKKKTKLKGMLNISLRVRKNGKVRRASVLKSSTLRSKHLRSCVTKALRGLTFEAPPKSGKISVEVRYEQVSLGG